MITIPAVGESPPQRLWFAVAAWPGRTVEIVLPIAPAAVRASAPPAHHLSTKRLQWRQNGHNFSGFPNFARCASGAPAARIIAHDRAFFRARRASDTHQKRIKARESR